jgi:MFS transporter, DHA3 family, macrolide efflux protein
VLIGGIVLGLLLGLFAGGSIWNLSVVRLRRLPFIAAAVLVRFATEAAIAGAIPLADQLRLPLYAFAYALLLFGLWPNRSYPGISLAFVGILANGIAITVNGGHMPIWEPSLLAAGIAPDEIRSSFHVVLPPTLDASFLLHAGPLADVVPIPLSYVRNVASIGDVFLASGLAFFLFATALRAPDDAADREMLLLQQRLRGEPPRDGLRSSAPESRVRPETALASATTVAVQQVGRDVMRPLPSEPVALETAAALAVGEATVAAPAFPPILERARRHPYVRLALNGSFSALWTGQLISLFGDRVHQIAIAAMVLQATRSPLAVAAVFFAATIPNLFLSPIAGTFVDRWDHQDVLVVTDLLRAALVLLIPIAAVTNLLLVYPLTFAISCISVFFRPARVAILPRLVPEDDLITANSLMWTGDTLADIIGYPVAGAFVAFVAGALPLAFWFDAATYVASAALLWTIVVPAFTRLAEPARSQRRSRFATELAEGWAFLRGETVLLANTIQAAVGQFTLGVLIALTPVYVTNVLGATEKQFPAWYGPLEAAIGIGNLVGGFVIGLVGARLAKGLTVIVGYALAGICVTLLGLTGNLLLAFGLMIGIGVANMVFVIPSQTLFQTRTPNELMGRVVGFRSALIYGSLTLAMAAGGLVSEVFGVSSVLIVSGAATVVAGLAGLLVPAVRDA